MCVKICPVWAKGYHRVAVASIALGRHVDAVDAYEAAVKLEPNNQALRTLLKTTRAHALDWTGLHAQLQNDPRGILYITPTRWGSVNIFDKALNPRKSLFLKRFPASQFKGLLGSGFARSTINAWQARERLHAGVQWLFRISRHISPVVEWILGWNILLLNTISGGDIG